MAERGPITGTSLYLVLKSNGLHRPKIRLKKFGFSPKTIPANIAKKLPSQLPTQSVFQLLSQTAHVRFRSRKRVHTRLRSKNRTQGHTRRNRGLPSPGHSVALRCQRNPFYSTTLLYTYISRFSVNPQHQQKRIIRQSCHHKFYPQPLFNFSYNRPTFAFTSESGHTLGSRRKIAHNGSHGETGGVSDGGGITTLGAFHTFRKPCVAGYQNGKLCRFWALVGGALEEHRKPSEQRCAYACRCPEGIAAPLGCVIQ